MYPFLFPDLEKYIHDIIKIFLGETCKILPTDDSVSVVI